MNNWIAKKNRLVEGLFVSSNRMLEVCRSAQWDLLEDRISERAKVLDEIEECDRNLKDISSDFDSKWTSILGHVRSLDQQIAQLVEKQCRSFAKRMVEIQDEKLELIQSLDIDPRGSQINAEG